MADYSEAREPAVGQWPIRGKESAWTRLEPLVTPAHLRAIHLFGIPLVSAIPDPVTGKYRVMDDDIVLTFIERAVALVEAETAIDLLPVDVEERAAFDRQEFEAWGYLKTNRKPISRVRGLSIQSSDGTDLYTFPLQWLETGYFHRGHLHIIPLAVTGDQGAIVPLTATGGITFMTMFGNVSTWMAAYWYVKYESGFKDGKLPGLLNDLVGTVAAIEILAALAATYAQQQSMSLGIDGLSQSHSMPGPQLFQVRIEQLTEKRQKLVGRIKTIFGQNLFVGNV